MTTNRADDVSHLDLVGLLVFGSLPKAALLPIRVVLEVWDDAPFGLRSERNVLGWLVTF